MSEPPDVPDRGYEALREQIYLLLESLDALDSGVLRLRIAKLLKLDVPDQTPCLESRVAELENEREALLQRISTLEGNSSSGGKLDRRSRELQNTISRLERENEALKKENERLADESRNDQLQVPRDPGQRARSLLYRFDASLTLFEGGGVADVLSVCVEYKEFDFAMTRENVKEDSSLVFKFMKKLAENICAALNARQNMTVYFGVVDSGGRVKGIEVEDFTLVTIEPA